MTAAGFTKFTFLFSSLMSLESTLIVPSQNTSFTVIVQYLTESAAVYDMLPITF